MALPDKAPLDILPEKSFKNPERVILLFDFPSELNRFWKLFSRLVPEVVEVEVEVELELEEFNDEIRLCKSVLILP